MEIDGHFFINHLGRACVTLFPFNEHKKALIFHDAFKNYFSFSGHKKALIFHGCYENMSSINDCPSNLLTLSM